MQDIEAVSEKVKVVLEDIGEGNCGDYDPEDPEDQPLVRFSVYRKYQPGEEMEPYFLDDETPVGDDEENYLHGWRPVSDGSYCTQLPATLPEEKLQQAAQRILDDIGSDIANQQRCKRRMEELSWIDESWLN